MSIGELIFPYNSSDSCWQEYTATVPCSVIRDSENIHDIHLGLGRFAWPPNLCNDLLKFVLQLKTIDFVMNWWAYPPRNDGFSLTSVIKDKLSGSLFQLDDNEMRSTYLYTNVWHNKFRSLYRSFLQFWLISQLDPGHPYFSTTWSNLFWVKTKQNTQN